MCSLKFSREGCFTTFLRPILAFIILLPPENSLFPLNLCYSWCRLNSLVSYNKLLSVKNGQLSLYIKIAPPNSFRLCSRPKKRKMWIRAEDTVSISQNTIEIRLLCGSKHHILVLVLLNM